MDPMPRNSLHAHGVQYGEDGKFIQLYFFHGRMAQDNRGNWRPIESFANHRGKKKVQGFWVATENKHHTFWPFLFPPFRTYAAVERFADQVWQKEFGVKDA